MKKSLILILAVFSVTAFAVETKKVCHEKNGKQVCKNVKVHKQLEGETKVPEKKGKK